MDASFSNLVTSSVLLYLQWSTVAWSCRKSLVNQKSQKSKSTKYPAETQFSFQCFHTSPELASSSWVSPGFTWAVASNGAKGKENIESESYQSKKRYVGKCGKRTDNILIATPTSTFFLKYHLQKEESLAFFSLFPLNQIMELLTFFQYNGIMVTFLKRHLIVLASAAHILTLEWYREDKHGPGARMTCKFKDDMQICEAKKKKRYLIFQK